MSVHEPVDVGFSSLCGQIFGDGRLNNYRNRWDYGPAKGFNLQHKMF